MDRWLLVSAGVALLAACAAKEAEVPEEPEPAQEQRTAPRTFADQVAAGEGLYGRHCASCHGDAGEGTDEGPRVVGVQQGALPLDPSPRAKDRTTQFRTAADVADFVIKFMPQDEPGSLDPHEYWSILAFDLKANGIDVPGKLDATTARQIVLHQ